MRIGIDARMMGKQQATGIGVYIEQIVTRIITKDTQNHYVIFVKPENKHLLDAYAHLPHVEIRLTQCHWYSVCEQVLFYAQLYRAKLDLLHVPQFNVPLLYNKPFIVTIHDVTPLRFPGHKMSSRIRRWAFNKVFHHALTKARAIITVSEYTKSQIQALFPSLATPCEVTYLGVENNFVREENYDKIQEVQKSFSLTKPYFLYLGVLRNHKNIHGLVRAFALIREKHEYALVLGGVQAPNYDELITALNELPEAIRTDVVLPGFVPDADVVPLYQGALAYVVPSFEEGFGINGLEAMTLGVPVIASQTGSLPEIYADAAHYCNPHDSASIADAMITMATSPDLRSSLIQKGYERLSHYSWDITANKTLRCYLDTK